MKKRPLILITVLGAIVLLFALLQNLAREEYVQILQTDYNVQLPDEYLIRSGANLGVAVIQKGIHLDGTLIPAVGPQVPRIYIWLTISDETAIQTSNPKFDFRDLFDAGFSTPERVDNEALAIYLAKAVEDEGSEVQLLVKAFVIEGDAGMMVTSSGEFEELEERYLLVKAILQSLRKVPE